MTRRTVLSSITTPTGPRSLTEIPSRRGGRSLAASAVLLCLLTVPASALDLFTLWHHEAGRFAIEAGDRVDYRSVTVERGRRREELVRLQCVEEDAQRWVLELLPLVADGEGLRPLPGEGWRLELAKTALSRAGRLEDHIGRVEQWLEGEPRTLSVSEWRDDPLLQTTLTADFRPESEEEQAPTTRKAGGRDLLCSQIVMVDRDTSRVELPRGSLLQIHTREVSASFHDDIPFLGMAHAAERMETQSTVEPAGARRPPPPRIRVETMELMDFARDATPWLGRG